MTTSSTTRSSVPDAGGCGDFWIGAAIFAGCVVWADECGGCSDRYMQSAERDRCAQVADSVDSYQRCIGDKEHDNAK